MNAYSKVYLSRARSCLARMLDFAVNDLGHDIDKFFNLFLSTDLAERFGSGEPAMVVGKSGVELAYEVLEKSKVITERKSPVFTYERSEEYWTGWVLAYYQWHTSLSFLEIVHTVPISTVRMMYFPYHEMDIAQFVDKMNELYLQANPNTKLKNRRLELGLSQQELSALSGVPVRTIQQYEQRQKNIGKANAEYLVMFACALSCDVEDLLDRV